MFYVYILQNLQTKKFYKGLTANLENRLKQHFEKKCQTTRKWLSIKIIHIEICDNRVLARKMEKFFKSGYGREIIKEIAQINE